MKKKIIIIFSILLILIASCIIGGLIFYKSGLSHTGNKNDTVVFVVEKGSTSRQIIDELYDANLIKNKMCGYIFLKTNNSYNLQAGTYELNKGMNLEDILSKISNGDILDNSIKVTFVEGKRMTNIAKTISKNFEITEEEVLEKINDKTFLEPLVEKYWFLTEEILNDNLYYALEGYLYPDTYAIPSDANLEEIITRMLDNTKLKLDKYKDKIENNKYSVHELLTLASIVELEGGNSNDRNGVAAVFYNRLNNGWSLGSDVTTYYAARVEMSERDLYYNELNAVNGYNTRSVTMAGKLPIGPICNMGVESIEAVINPTQSDYFYFVADKNGKTYFTKTEAEHQQTISKLKAQGLWYEYK